MDLLPSDKKFNSEYFDNSIIPQINTLAYPKGYKYGNKRCLLHFDNAPSHKSALIKSVFYDLNQSFFKIN